MTKQIDIQDRFRFRAWYMPICEDDKPCYVYDVEQLYDGRTNKGFSDELGWASSFGTLLDSPEQFIVEQCTGLKDKNGKLIYEGDIIKQGNSIYKVIFSYDDVASCGCCVGKFSGCGFVMEDKYGSRGDLDIYSELEVIGNIHKNPELLENKDE